MLGNIMYFHKGLQQPNAICFVQEVVKEVNGCVNNKQWELIKLSDVPKNMEMVPLVWTLHHKDKLITNEVTNYRPD